MSEKTSTITKVRIREDIEPPKNFKVIYVNDEVTTMDFVTSSLVEVFQHDFDTALELCRKVHEEKSAVVAVLPYELAEHKSMIVVLEARKQGYPLQVNFEPDN